MRRLSCVLESHNVLDALWRFGTFVRLESATKATAMYPAAKACSVQASSADVSMLIWLGLTIRRRVPCAWGTPH